ncbi:hypothetical protein ACA910_005597 [Epithemia clementina (nom. ined.)]
MSHYHSSRKSDTCLGKTSGKPLTEYDSLEEATAGAEAANERFQMDLVPYECDECGKYHLSPQSRDTPSYSSAHGCNCRDSQGQPKDAYPSRADALNRAQIIQEERNVGGVHINVYECPVDANVFHLTHASAPKRRPFSSSTNNTTSWYYDRDDDYYDNYDGWFYDAVYDS